MIQGQKLTMPERVPFRLTQNVIDGFGVTGVEGAFRITSEISMELLRRNKDCLRAVLDAFIHDPLTQWSQELVVLVSPHVFLTRVASVHIDIFSIG